MNIPDARTFHTEAERVFSFLIDNGFSVTDSDRTDTILTAGVTFRGRHVAISLGLDRRDACVDCYITRIIDGDLTKNNVPGGYCGHLCAFLVKHRGYRGGCKEFTVPSGSLESYQAGLVKYAECIRALTPDIIQDSSSIFNNTWQQQ